MKAKGFSIRYNPEENCFDTSRFDEFGVQWSSTMAHSSLVAPVGLQLQEFVDEQVETGGGVGVEKTQFFR